MHPILWQFKTFTIYSYTVMLSLALLVWLIISLKEARRKQIPANDILNFVIYGIIAGLIGSRLLYLLFFYPQVLFSNTIGIFRIWEGGRTTIGFTASLLAIMIIIYSRKKQDVWIYADTITPGAAAGYAIMKLGCFFNGCCYGKPASVPWTIVFHNKSSAVPLDIPMHPVQLYSSFLGIIAFVVLWHLRKKPAYPGFLFSLFLFVFSLGLFILDFYRGDRVLLHRQTLFSASQLFYMSVLIFSCQRFLKTSKIRQIAEQ